MRILRPCGCRRPVRELFMRINVAISRAQVLALVFASRRFREVPCSNVEEMSLVNSLCALGVNH